jgi:type IV secretory pathway TrbD component
MAVPVMSGLTRNPVYRALNIPMTVGGVERRMFGLAMLGGLLVLIAFGMTGAGLTFGLLFLAGRWATNQDPQLPYILVAARRFRNLYDPVKREWYGIQ